MTGSLDKHIMYAKEKPIRPCVYSSMYVLKTAKSIEVELGSCFDKYTAKDVREGDLVFIDPPYESSTVLYGIKDSQTERLKTYIEELRKTGVPIIFTYGQSAPEMFPEYDWKFVKQQQVVVSKSNPVTVVRDEWVCYFNYEGKQTEKYNICLFDE